MLHGIHGERTNCICHLLGIGHSDDVGISNTVMQARSTDRRHLTSFDKACVDAVRRAAERLGYSHKDMVSGAGHDACHIASVAPTAMIFCPCVGGVSHNEAEEISPEWAAAGADVLFHAVVETAGVVEG